MTGKRAPTEIRFREKFHSGSPDECWPWLANKNGMGYGLIYDNERKRKVLAHRYAYELHHGCTLPKGQSVVIMHTCDNPICVNPSHLSLGTMKTNYDDMAAKGRRRIVCTVANLGPQRRGSACPQAKLTEEMVRKIRADIAGGEPTRAVARRLGMDASTIRHIRDRKSWKHV